LPAAERSRSDIGASRKPPEGLGAKAAGRGERPQSEERQAQGGAGLTANAKGPGGARDAPSRLGGVRRSSIRLSEEDFIRTQSLRPAGLLPLLATPTVSGIDLVGWAERHREILRSRLVENGAILFRGFPLSGVEGFEEIIRVIGGPLLDYKYGSTPRSHVSGGIYTSTEYPAHQEIPLHNEMSYSRDWPLSIWFLCVEPASRGGETPIADSRRVFERIDSGVRDRMIRKGILYVRNYGEGLDVPWQKVFQTEDREAVEEFCRK